MAAIVNPESSLDAGKLFRPLPRAIHPREGERAALARDEDVGLCRIPIELGETGMQVRRHRDEHRLARLRLFDEDRSCIEVDAIPCKQAYVIEAQARIQEAHDERFQLAKPRERFARRFRGMPEAATEPPLLSVPAPHLYNARRAVLLHVRPKRLLVVEGCDDRSPAIRRQVARRRSGVRHRFEDDRWRKWQLRDDAAHDRFLQQRAELGEPAADRAGLEPSREALLDVRHDAIVIDLVDAHLTERGRVRRCTTFHILTARPEQILLDVLRSALRLRCSPTLSTWMLFNVLPERWLPPDWDFVFLELSHELPVDALRISTADVANRPAQAFALSAILVEVDFERPRALVVLEAWSVVVFVFHHLLATLGRCFRDSIHLSRSAAS
ncbi:MAG TPA: hypothetical protein VNI54_04625 [Thermoanaerobaculia bacterium]|nr:hypothetical protein [Thermoanaerobaculia bacterium]